jgi:hypothetical protein
VSATYVQSELDVLSGIAHDPTPRAVNDRAEIARAIEAAAADRHGLVHITGIRRHLPATVAPSYIGATVNRLARRGVLVKTGRYEPNAGASRNASKPSPVWRLKRRIESGDIA